MKPGKFREQLEASKQELRDLEEELERRVGMVGYNEVRHALVEAWEALDRATEYLDQNYKKLV